MSLEATPNSLAPVKPVVHYFRPSLESFSGSALGLAGAFGFHHPSGSRFHRGSLFDRIFDAVVGRVIVCVVAFFAVALDLVSWAWATLTVYHAWQIGFSNHMANLTSTIAMCFFTFPVLFGYQPKMAHFRPSYVLWPLNFLKEDSKSEQINLLTGGSMCITVNEEAIRECLDAGRPELVKKALDNIFPDARIRANDFGYLELGEREMKNFLSLGFDPNVPNPEGKTALLGLITRLRDNDLSSITNLFQLTVQVDPRLRKPIDVHFRDRQGFDAISRVLTGIRNSNHLFLSDLNSNSLYQLIEKLVQEGAFIPSLGFKEYQDFLQESVDTYSSFESNPNAKVEELELTLKEFASRRSKDNNPLIRLAAPDLHTNPIRNTPRRFLPHAAMLVTLAPRIEALWNPILQKRTEHYTQAVDRAFKELQIILHGGNDGTGPIIKIIVECLLSEAPTSLGRRC
jgi:hypothetical protein